MRTSPNMIPAPASTIAAVDLGSNSVQLLIAEAAGGRLRVLEHIKKTVGLGVGLGADGRLSAPARSRALECLSEFGQRLQPLPGSHVRAVGTCTLRRALDVGGFLVEAEAALGHRLEIITGVEEARLIYSGVVRDLGQDSPRRLVVDIGGGSTELIAGELAAPICVNSVLLGVIAQSRDYFPCGTISEARWNAAVQAASEVLAPLAREYREAGWDVALGASGSVRAIHTVCAKAGWCGTAITRQALQQLAAASAGAGHIDKLAFEGLSSHRRPIFVGGAVILTAIFDSLGLTAMTVSDNALRDGVLLEMLGRF